MRCFCSAPKCAVKLACAIFIFGVIACVTPSFAASSSCDGAGNCYIRGGASGSGTGANWTNALTGFGTGAGQVDPSAMSRGVTYWIAAGSYGKVAFRTPDSGTSVITLEGVTAANHGPAADWSSSFAGSAVFAGDDSISTDYWTINGQAVSGCTYPSNNASCYTIKFWNQTDIAGSIVTLGGGVSNLNLEYLEMVGTGMTGGAFPNNSTADLCSSDGCGNVNDVGIYEATSPISNLYFGYNYIHHIGTNMFLFNVTGSGQSINQTVTWDHNWFAYNHTGQNGLHTEAGSMYVTNFTVEDNVLQDISGSGEITSAGAATPPMANWDIHGNLFFWDTAYASLAGRYHQATVDDGIIDFLGEQMSGYIRFYNNTMAGFNNSVATGSGSAFSTIAVDANSGWSTCGSSCPTVQIYNNVWWNSAWVTGDYPSYCQIVKSATCTQDYDAIYYGSVPSGAVDAPSETHGYVVTSSSATPFVNSSASTLAGFEPASPDPFTSNAGLSMAAPYNVDMLGATRGADGTWDRGALQMASSTQGTLQSIAVTPANPSIVANGTEQLTATGTYSSGTTADLTNSVTWTSGTNGVASISNGGTATGLEAGTSTIAATSGSITGSTKLTVTAATLKSIAVTPANASIATSASEQYTATGTYSNGTTQNITSSVTWTSSNASAATISSAGLAKGVAAGTATISATSGSLSGSTGLTITTAAVTLKSISVAPANASITAGGTEQYTATGTYSNGTTQNITSSVKWSSSNSSVATISSSGLASTLAAGSTTITATSGAITGSTTLTVNAQSAPTMVSITVTPASQHLRKGQTLQLKAVGHYSNGTTNNLTASATWASSNHSVATVSSSGIVSAIARGSATITATVRSEAGSSQITVGRPE